MSFSDLSKNLLVSLIFSYLVSIVLISTTFKSGTLQLCFARVWRPLPMIFSPILFGLNFSDLVIWCCPCLVMLRSHQCYILIYSGCYDVLRINFGILNMQDPIYCFEFYFESLIFFKHFIFILKWGLLCSFFSRFLK